MAASKDNDHESTGGHDLPPEIESRLYELAELSDLFQRQNCALRLTLGFAPPAGRADMESVAERLETATNTMRALAGRPEVVGIGEVGLDYWVVKEAAARELQQEILKQFVELSKELNLPLNIHSRSAGRHAIALLLENNAPRVQMHAFDGKAGAALPAVEAGYFFSIPPSVIRSRQKQKLVKQLPLSCQLVETDSPVLGPSPEERNEPANILQSIKAIAALKDVTEEEVIAAVSENTKRLYGKL